MKRSLLFLLAALSTIMVNGQNTVSERFAPPAGFERTPAAAGSFTNYLRSLPLKPAGSPVLLYNGQRKGHQVHAAVVDLPIGKRNLHQCADAVIRLRADYLYQQDRKDEISFHLTNGFAVPYSRWMQGERVAVEGNKTWWVARTSPADNATSYFKYLEFIWSYAGTLSLSKELKPIPLSDLDVGDVFIYGGSPGHAIIVIDCAVNPRTGQKKFMLAQSYMPAQELHILLDNDYDGVWYDVPQGQYLNTPEWRFEINELKRF